MMMMISV